MKASVILPAYNEEKNIGKVIEAVKKTGKYEIIVVDDGSKDRTAEIAKEHGCITLRLSKNMGKGYACTQGAKIASHQNIIFIDSDAQHDAREIPLLLEGLKNHDLVLGMRSFDDIPMQRKFSNTFARRVTSAAAKKKFSDVLCGFRAIKKDKFFGLKINKTRYEFEAEMLIKAARSGMKITEVPVTVYYGVGSSMPPHESAKVTAYILGQVLRR